MNPEDVPVQALRHTWKDLERWVNPAFEEWGMHPLTITTRDVLEALPISRMVAVAIRAARSDIDRCCGPVADPRVWSACSLHADAGAALAKLIPYFKDDEE